MQHSINLIFQNLNSLFWFTNQISLASIHPPKLWWSNRSKLLFPSFLPLFLSPLIFLFVFSPFIYPAAKWPLKSGYGEHCQLPSGVWGKTPSNVSRSRDCKAPILKYCWKFSVEFSLGSKPLRTPMTEILWWFGPCNLINQSLCQNSLKFCQQFLSYSANKRNGQS